MQAPRRNPIQEPFFLFFDENSRKKKLFNLDLHISVIKDVESILNIIFPDKFEITNWSLSGHNFVFGNKKANVDIVNEETWESIDADMIEAFYQRYKTELAHYDGFIVTHTPVFCLLFEKFNKPILCINSCRYDNPFNRTNNKEMFHYLNQSLRRMVLEKRMLTIISNNIGDRDYLKLGTGLDSIYLPSLCLYTKATYNPHPDPKKRLGVINYSKFVHAMFLKSILDMPAKYDWADLYKYDAIVHFPYESSTMSLFEQFSAGVPILLPTPQFFLKTFKLTNHDFYWLPHTVPDSLRETIHDSWWLRRSDFYNEMKDQITFFNSMEELFIIVNFKRFKIPDVLFLENRKQQILKKWKKIIQHIFYV